MKDPYERQRDSLVCNETRAISAFHGDSGPGNGAATLVRLADRRGRPQV